MAKFNKQISPEVCLEIARLVRAGEIASLKIQARKSGKNKGNIIADYVTQESVNPIEHESDERTNVVNALHKVASALTKGKTIALFYVIKDGESYQYALAVK